MPTLLQVKDAIKATVATLNTTGGAAVTLPVEKIYTVYTDKKANTTNDADYPKTFIMADSGDSAKQPSGRSLRKDTFRVVVVLKENANGMTAVHDKILQLVDDFERLFNDNSTLGNIVEDVEFKGYSTDGGATHPEAILLLTLSIEWYRQF